MRNSLFPQPSASRRLRTRRTSIKDTYLLLFLFLVLTVAPITGNVSYTQHLFWAVLNFIQTFGALRLWLKALKMRKMADDLVRSGSCSRKRKISSELLDKDVETMRIDRQIQTAWDCSAHEHEGDDGLAESPQTDNKELLTVVRPPSHKQDYAERAVQVNMLMTPASKESQVQRPNHKTFSTETLEISSAKRGGSENDASVTKQELDTDHERTISFDNIDVKVKYVMASPEKTPRKVKLYKRIHQKRISSDYMKKSLQFLQCRQPQSPEHKKKECHAVKQKRTMCGERQHTLKTSLLQDLLSPSRFVPRTRELQVFMCHGPQRSSEEEMWSEMSRLASFNQYSSVPPSGVWVVHLAAAGFYCPDKDSPMLRCAFCGVEVGIGRFQNTAASDVHRAASPSCPLVSGTAPNKPVAQQSQAANFQYVQTLFEPGARADLSSRGQGHQQQDPKEPGEAVLQSSQMTCSGHSSQSQSPGSAQGSGSLRMPASTPFLPGAQSPAFPSMSPASAPSSSAGADGRRNGAADYEALPLEQPWERSSSQNQGQAPNAGSLPSQPGFQTTEAQAATWQSSSTTGNTQAPQTPFQTARPEERRQEGSGERPSAGGHSGTATAASPGHPPHSASPNETVRQLVTYAQLGIYTQEPKRPDLAIAGTRIRTFTGWPHARTHRPEDMAEAGFYFVGVEDLVRCFYCKGGLKAWSTPLRPWVEHARFYPKCPFVGQVKGKEFIEVVERLKGMQEEISEAEVESELRNRHLAECEGGTATSANGITEGGKAAKETATGVLDEETGEGAMAGTAFAEDEIVEMDESRLEEAAEELECKNQDIKNERICKICQVEDVSILFLPCGHLVSCSQCAPALRTCAVCRQRVKGRVRVPEDDEYKRMDAAENEAEDAMVIS